MFTAILQAKSRYAFVNFYRFFQMQRSGRKPVLNTFCNIQFYYNYIAAFFLFYAGEYYYFTQNAAGSESLPRQKLIIFTHSDSEAAS